MRPRVSDGLGATLALLAIGCATSIGSHESGATELVGEWVDVAKTTPRDSMIWVLGAKGDDRLLRLRLATTSAGSDSVERTDDTYSRWYLQGRLDDTTGRALCFTKRPAHFGPTCYPFRMDTIKVDGAMRRRIVVLGYAGRHHTTDRPLIERVP
ncbi:MAG TPA: hypothetical protein VEI06_06675 [Gemmatimonadaceae bacterium]|nr:hypothetical protein [Gemmatimonadaceae bacterium]